MTGLLASTSWSIDVSGVLVAVGSLTGLVLTWRIRKEQKPNGGSSQRDAIDRIEGYGATITKRLDGIDSTLVDQTNRIDRGAMAIDRLEQRIDHLTDRRTDGAL